MDRINADLLRTFVEVAKVEHLSRAAEALQADQSTVSRKIARLEQEVGVLLFERIGRNIRLTQAGRRLVGRAERILDDLRTQCDVVVIGVGDCGSCSASAVADGLLLEQAGIPAAVICSDAFRVSADAMAGLRGAPGYQYVTTPHPVANLSPDGVRDRAAAALPAVVGLLTQPGATASS